MEEELARPDSCDPTPGELVMMWGYADGEGPDICYFAGEGVDRTDQRLLHNVLASPRMVPDLHSPLHFTFDPSFIDQLKSRGYDVTTLRLSIRKMANP